jgi:hypothetical protein
MNEVIRHSLRQANSFECVASPIGSPFAGREDLDSGVRNR